MDLREISKTYRKEHHLTQKEFAAQDPEGIFKLSAVANIERSFNYQAGPIILAGMARAMRITTPELVTMLESETHTGA